MQQQTFTISPLLIADPDPVFRDSIRSDPKAHTPSPVFAQNPNEAQLLLADPKRKFSGIFINPRISECRGLSLVHCAHQHQLGTPVFFIYDSEVPPVSSDQFKSIAVHDALSKPLSYTELAQLISPLLISFDPQAALSKRSTSPAGTEHVETDDKFTPIQATSFISGKTSFFDIYIRLSAGRYVKLIQAGENFQPERLSRYLNKGVTHFYLRKDAQAAYLSYCEHLAAKLVQSAEIPTTLKVTQTANFGGETLKSLKEYGVTVANLEFASRFATHTQKLARQLQLEKNDSIEGFLADLHAFEHGVSTAIVSALMIRTLHIDAERVQEAIGLASLLHDLGLHQLAPELETEDESAMTHEQRAFYHTHPTLGAQTLCRVRGVQPIVVQALAQHHERRDGKGFPARLGAGKISRIAEIVGLSDEFVQLMVRMKTRPQLNPFFEMHQQVFDGFSSEVVDAFCMLFLRNRAKGRF